MCKFPNKFRKPCFWPILGPFSQFLRQKIFSWKIWLCYAQLHMGFQNHAKIQKKLMYNSKKTPRQTEGWTEDGQTLFYRTLLATAGSPISVMIKNQSCHDKKPIQKKIMPLSRSKEKQYLKEIQKRTNNRNHTKFQACVGCNLLMIFNLL